MLDGVTDKSGFTYEHGGTTETSGRFAALVVSEALARLDATGEAPDAAAAVSFIGGRLDDAVREQRPSLAREQRPACALVVYSAPRHEVWRVGDCSWLFDGVAHSGHLAFDDLTAGLRRTVTQVHLEDGWAVEHLAARDPGRTAIQGLLEMQGMFANRDHELGYGAITGTPVPDRFLEVDALDGSGVLVLTSDGYPEIVGDREASDRRLTELLGSDPLCIGALLGTKAPAPGAASYDDRTWVSLRV
ncbi:hypothetical protein GCM10009844_35440 [Nocardioides koreensis]|uniref:PPM-type phosphatase domain-containing protein n=1 Tax=Nocardioides koreensis TaxID=433651 RepID=A0ABP5LVJ6_9ACTN